MRRIIATLVAGLMLSACAGVGEAGGEADARSAVAPAADPGTCPVTSAQPGFVPPDPYPPEPPFGQVWYGTGDLWTLLDPGPVTWRLDALPVRDGTVFDKTLWFGDTFTTVGEEDLSGDPAITLTATRLDAPSPAVRSDHGSPSFNEEIGNFLLVGLELPAEPGCWRVTAAYHGAELGYVLEVRA